MKFKDLSIDFFCNFQIGFIPLIFFGVFNIPFGPAKPYPLTMVVGKPIPVPKIEGEPTEEMLNKYLKLLIESYERIYNTHKDRFGMGNIKLRIV